MKTFSVLRNASYVLLLISVLISFPSFKNYAFLVVAAGSAVLFAGFCFLSEEEVKSLEKILNKLFCVPPEQR